MEPTPSKTSPTPALRSRSAPIIERAPLPIVEVQGSAHLVSHVNSAFCSLLGKTKAELIGNPFSQIVPGGDECVTILDRVYLTGEAVTHSREDPSEDHPTHWLYAMWPALDADEHPVGVIIQLTKAANFRKNTMEINEALVISGMRQHELRDEAEKLNAQLRAEVAVRKKSEAALDEAINELKTAQEATERASKAKDEFLAALSHELRTPLTPVLLIAAALREDERLPADVREQLGLLERNITLEAHLIDDLLDLTKISHGKLQFRAEPCNAHLLIDFAIEIVREDALAKEISIERTFAARRCGLLADPTRFQQVVWNLLRNAVKFTPRGGRISIFTCEEKGAKGETWLRIEVTDTGIGIDPARLDQIFLPFEQGGLAGDHRFGGVGLGLAIARAVVCLHDGRISAESEGPNRGSTFVVELPGAFTPDSNLADASPSASAPPFQKVVLPVAPLRLLLVEDHESTLQTLSRLLQRDGHRVVTATTVAEAQSAAVAGTFDLVVSDLGLPDGSGTELMESLRDTYGLRGIALSGYGTEEDIARSLAAGFVAHLIKPIPMAEFRRILASFAPAGS